MNKRQLQLISYLEDQKQWFTAAQLADFLHVSARTIRSDVVNINFEQSDIIVSSNRFGYKYNPNSIKKKIPIKFDFDSYERMVYVLLCLITSFSKSVDFFDLADELYISDSSIFSDIQNLKKTLLKYSVFNLKLNKSGKTIKLNGSFNDSIKFLYTLLRHNYNALSVECLQKFFPSLNISKLNEDVSSLIQDKAISKYSSYLEVLVNCAVLLESKFDIIDQDIANKEYIQLDDFLELYSFIDQLNKRYHMTLSRNQCLLFIDTMLRSIEFEQKEIIIREKITIDTSYGLEYRNFLYQVLTEIETLYANKLTDDVYNLQNFISHMIISIERTKHNIYYYNPLKERIYKEFPFMYDLALYCAKRINDQYHIQLSDDEVTLFVMYFSQYANTKFITHQIPSLYVYSQQGTLVCNFIARKLQDSFPNCEIIIINMLSPKVIDEIIHKDSLVISTEDKLPLELSKKIYINNLLSMSEITEIKKYIDLAKEHQYQEKFEAMFTTFFNEDAFYIQLNRDIQNKDCILKSACDTLNKNGYVNLEFFDNVMYREQLNSTEQPTAVAIPHTTELCAIKTTIFLQIFKRSVLWNKEKIKIMMLFAIEKKDQAKLHEFYALLSNIISNKDNILLISKADSFHGFKEIFYQIYKRSIRF